MISVCVTTYNGELYIRQQLDSILSQLCEDDEIIISDDGSTDDTLNIITSYADHRITLLHHKQNSSVRSHRLHKLIYVSQNVEYAIRHSHGDYIFLADQDDIWDCNRVKIVNAYLQKSDLVLCNHSVIDAGNNIEIDAYYKHNPISRCVLYDLVKTPFLGCCMAFRREAMKYVLPIPSRCVSFDNWMGCAVVLNGTFSFIQTPLHLYRHHSNNTSPTTDKSKNSNSLLYKISYRAVMLAQLLLRTIQHRVIHRV